MAGADPDFSKSDPKKRHIKNASEIEKANLYQIVRDPYVADHH